LSTIFKRRGKTHEIEIFPQVCINSDFVPLGFHLTLPVRPTLSRLEGKIAEDCCALMAEYMNSMQDDMSNLNGMGVKLSFAQYIRCN